MSARHCVVYAFLSAVIHDDPLKRRFAASLRQFFVVVSMENVRVEVCTDKAVYVPGQSITVSVFTRRIHVSMLENIGSSDCWWAFLELSKQVLHDSLLFYRKLWNSSRNSEKLEENRCGNEK